MILLIMIKLLSIKIFKKIIKKIKLILPSSRLSPKIYNNSSCLTSNNSIVIEDDDNDNVNKIDWDGNKQNIINFFT
jgi:hypothetical protein